MRRKKWRIVIVGHVLIVIALVFFFFMLSIASKSNDPVALMQTVGTVAGAVGGISLVMIIIGLIGNRVYAAIPVVSLNEAESPSYSGRFS
jgi:nitrate reductase gamma subunit